MAVYSSVVCRLSQSETAAAVVLDPSDGICAVVRSADSAVGCRWQSQIKTGDHHQSAESQFQRQVSVRNFFEIHPGLGGIPICGGGHRISPDHHCHRIRMLPHHIRDHRSAPVSSWFDPIRISPELWVSIPAESHSIHAGQVTATASTDLKTG